MKTLITLLISMVGRDGVLISDFSPRTQPYDTDLVAVVELALSGQ
jgi:hypothetical protein